MYKVYLEDNGNYSYSQFDIKTKSIIPGTTKTYSTKKDCIKEFKGRRKNFQEFKSVSIWHSKKVREKYGYKFNQ